MDRVLEFIDDNIASSIYGRKTVNGRYHHNSSYSSANSIVKHGILSMKDLHNSGINIYSLDALERASNHLLHINGNDGISLAVVGLTDLYKDEDEYDPYKLECVDFVVDDSIKACRSTLHYGNEFISYNSIPNDKINAVDIRLRKYLRLASNINDVNKAIRYYEDLREIASTLKECSLDIPLREMSSDNYVLDIDRVSNMPKIKTLFK